MKKCKCVTGYLAQARQEKAEFKLKHLLCWPVAMCSSIHEIHRAHRATPYRATFGIVFQFNVHFPQSVPLLWLCVFVLVER